ncbi:MAG: T9SS type A sorting domain-containing protein [Bacteroidota bacterium]|nr:T9SS type A sorting domain-containing protein [Bacteroidota bacterium]
MLLKKALVLLCILVAFLFISSNSFAQKNSSIINLTFTTNEEFAPIQYLKIGNCTGCTYDIDSIVNKDKVGVNFAEFENPTWPPTFSVMSVDLPDRPPRTNSGMYNDYRGYNPIQKDTFYVEIKHGDGTDTSSLLIKWSIDSLAERCDSMFLINLKDPIGYPNPSNDDIISMFEVDNVFISEYTVFNPYPQMTYMIIKYGVKLADSLNIDFVGDVKQEGTIVPQHFGLYSNYPNPFNPNTTIRFDMQKRAIADISIYNALGQKVITLFSEELQPGTYSTIWNGVNTDGQSLSSGVYYVRMLARTLDGNEQDFSALRKLILLK